MEKDNLCKVLERFRDRKILVVGDIILDKFIRGKVTRISPEAPVPIVEVTSEDYMPGGAGNVVNNLLALGTGVYTAGVTGKDVFAEQLLDILSGMGADTSGIIEDPSRPTSRKTRIIAEHQQVVRADCELRDEISVDLAARIIGYINEIAQEIDGIIISDYGKGLVTSDLIECCIKNAKKRNIPVVVDPQAGHFFEYKDVTSITPNVKEAGEALKVDIVDEESLVNTGKRLLEELHAQSILVTRGEKGMSLFLKDGSVESIPAKAREVFDVSGAGDTVVSVFTLGLTIGLDFLDSAVLSNYAAAVVVGKLGTATVSVEELAREIGK
ncbi:MAG: D-glycero-beta-D-manno-heptose-7-phosphate kinase [Elusimicrobiota bacterium]